MTLLSKTDALVLVSRWQALATLGTEGTAKSTTAQVIAEIAQAEIPHDFWPDVIPTLLHRLGEGQPDEAKVAALEAVGYICETVVSGR